MADEPHPRIPISADWILNRIQEGKKVRLKNAVIEGDLDLNKMDMHTQHVDRSELQKIMGLQEDVKIVQSSIEIINSKIQGNLDFSNAVMSEMADFSNAAFSENAHFKGTTFSENARFKGATFSEFADFSYVTFSRNAWFGGVAFSRNADFSIATFSRNVDFKDAIFSGFADFSTASFTRVAGHEDQNFSGIVDFRSATFGWFADFKYTTFRGMVHFRGVTFTGLADFSNSTFSGNVGFNDAAFSADADFSNSIFSGDADFGRTKFDGDDITFRDAIFTYKGYQEDACRRAKNVQAKTGNREEEEYYFYREMEAKRIQKGIRRNSGLGLRECFKNIDTWSFRRFFFHDVIEYIFVQGMFGYGVHPKRLIISWGAIVLAFGFIYWYGDGIIGTTDRLDYIKVSFATAIAPGYIAAIINPESAGYRLVPAYQLVAMIETIVGTFLWAGFIATFAKKYMR